ncbi:MAG TPA: NAD(P)/FAD-dependent oxidoreductase [Chthoniobacterales bacterium]|jgi:geranylgeranyl reductase family protein
MEIFDVAVIGGGPAGSVCAAFCAASGLSVVLIEREKFPREKVCGDCLNPECWPILRRLGIDQRVRVLPHGALDWVEFINVRDVHLRVDLPRGENAEIAIKRSGFDSILLERAREFGSEVREASTLTSIEKSDGGWKLRTSEVTAAFGARVLVGADGRNSTVARLLGLLPRIAKERVALQAHIPLPRGFGNRVVLQLLPGGYSGQAPVNDTELNLCLVGRPKSIRALQHWATQHFNLGATQTWRTITPLARSALSPARENVLFVGDAARVVEPFTGEGIFYALRSGELAAAAVKEMIRGDAAEAVRNYAAQHAAMYGGRLWINALARSAVVSPKLGSILFGFARFQPALLGLFTRKIVRHPRANSKHPVAKF